MLKTKVTTHRYSTQKTKQKTEQKTEQNPEQKTIYLSNREPPNKFDGWSPKPSFKATEQDCLYMWNVVYLWDKTTFHITLKNFEIALLKDFSDMINRLYKSCDDNILNDWINTSTKYWRRLALIRDYQDYKCGRDSTHYIRTDDCRRFVSCVSHGIKSGLLPKPVYRLLGGTTSPRKFSHPLFTRFNIH